MQKLNPGRALLDHRSAGAPKLYCRIVYVDRSANIIVLSPLPTKNKHGHQKNYVRSPVFQQLSVIEDEIAPGRLSVVDFETPSHWLFTASDLRQERAFQSGRKTRKFLRKWVRKKAKAYGHIRPFVHGRSIEEIILDPELAGWPRRRAQELGFKGYSQVQRSLNAYILGLGERNSLLPWYTNNGAPGKPKLSTKPTGRPKEFQGGDAKSQSTLNCDEKVRLIFALGWKKYKKLGVSVASAFTKTKLEFFRQSIGLSSPQSDNVQLLPEAFRYTEAQFEYWGKRGDGALTPMQIERGETAAKAEYLRRQGNFMRKHITANGEALLDSTSCDQTLVSCASRLKVLSSPWRTSVVGSSVGYIFGHHVGFESPSATTALLAILHASESKVDYCARFGIAIKERDWLPMTFRKFAMDNGEGKNQLTMSTLEELRSGASFGSSYDAINKALAESEHKKTQAHVDHHMPASTMGERPKRGEPDRSSLARLNFFEYMPHLIKHILRVNNDEIIKLPRIEMRDEGVEPTRRGVIEWMMKKGYMTSTATDLTALRIKCLPRVKAVMRGDGLHLFDPTYQGNRLIPELVYRSEWLLKSGLLQRAHARSWQSEVHIDPSHLAQIWVNLDGMKCLQLQSSDPDIFNLTLIDWIAVSRDDRLSAFLSNVQKTQQAVDKIEAINRDTSKANAERKAEGAALAKSPSKSEIKRKKRENTANERSALTGIPKPVARQEEPNSLPSTIRGSRPHHTDAALEADFSDAIAALQSDED